MKYRKNIIMVFGTRPEAIKLAPLIEEFKKEKEHFNLKICLTGQHQEMLDQVLNIFKIKCNYNLNVMKRNQTLTEITGLILNKLKKVFLKEKPHHLIVQGDTTTTFASSLSAFYEKIPISHVEAGLRTYNPYSPWPEEINRRLTSQLASLHFAPTINSKNNLISENINRKSIYVTGNTVIDALFSVQKKIFSSKPLLHKLQKKFGFLQNNRKLILVTGHRRESFGEGFTNICRALIQLIEIFPDIEIVYPVHLNPNVRKVVFKILNKYPGSSKSNRIHLIEPLDYIPFVYLMKISHLILTDSGGIQEEAPSLGKPVLVLRETTERPEAVKAGTVRLIGTDENIIIKEAQRILKDQTEYNKMSRAHNPYGDGKASRRIISILKSII